MKHLYHDVYNCLVRGKIESYVIRPPDQDTLERARIHRQKQRKMYDILRELLFFFIFFTLLVIVSNGFRDPMAMRLRESLVSLLFHGEDFENVRIFIRCCHFHHYLTFDIISRIFPNAKSLI